MAKKTDTPYDDYDEFDELEQDTEIPDFIRDTWDDEDNDGGFPIW